MIFRQNKGTLYLVDLAGSEKVAKTHVSGQQLDEAKGINKSLSTLGKVIHALTDHKSTHVPYRDSKLTRILSESLGGNAKTCLIIACSPSPYNELETMSTLRFGTAARNIKNKPKVNKEYTVPELKLMVAKRDQLIYALKKRIKFLEEFIKDHGLEIPPDEFLDGLTHKLLNDAEDPIGHEDNVKFDLSPKSQKIKDEEAESDEEDHKEDINIDFDEPLDPTQSTQFEIEEIQNDSETEDIELQLETQKVIQMIESNTTDNKKAQKELIDKFWDLQEQLKVQKMNWQQQIDVLSNLNDDYEVVKGKLQKYQTENDELIKSKESVEHTIVAYQEKLQESDNENIALEAKFKTVENELTELKKLFAVAKTKIQRYEENGIEMLMEEAKSSQDFRKELLESNEQIRQEIIKGNINYSEKGLHIDEAELVSLYNQIKEKDEIIQKIQNLPDLEKNIKGIIEESKEKITKMVKESKKKPSGELIKKVLMGDADVDIKGIKEAWYLTIEEAAELAEKQAKLRNSLKKEINAKKKLKVELEKLKKTLSVTKNIDSKDLEAITNAMIEDKLHEVKEKYEKEREQIMVGLKDRVEKVIELKIQLDSLQEENQRLESLLGSGSYSAQKHIKEMEKQIEALTIMFHQSSSEWSVVKVDLQSTEKKLKTKEKKIEELEKRCKEIKDQRDRLDKIAKQLKTAVENEKFSRPSLDPNNLTGIPSQGRVVKKIVGGKGRVTNVKN